MKYFFLAIAVLVFAPTPFGKSTVPIQGMRFLYPNGGECAFMARPPDIDKDIIPTYSVWVRQGDKEIATNYSRQTVFYDADEASKYAGEQCRINPRWAK